MYQPRDRGRPMRSCTPEQIDACRRSKRRCSLCPPMPPGGWKVVLKAVGYTPPLGEYWHGDKRAAAADRERPAKRRTLSDRRPRSGRRGKK